MFVTILYWLVYLATAFCVFNVILGLTKQEVLGRGMKRISKYYKPKQYDFYFKKYLIVSIFVIFVLVVIV